jgi:hypothetical protein
LDRSEVSRISNRGKQNALPTLSNNGTSPWGKLH